MGQKYIHVIVQLKVSTLTGVYTITVGAGGATMSVSSDTATLNAGGNAGTDSSLSGSDITTITSLGGGCGTYYPSSTYGGY